MTLIDFLNDEHEKALADPMVTKHISPYHAWQGRESEAPVLGRRIARVRPLSWVGNGRDYATADCILGRYTVIDTYHDRGFMLQSSRSASATYFPTLDEAKEAAQIDYESLILSAFEVEP